MGDFPERVVYPILDINLYVDFTGYYILYCSPISTISAKIFVYCNYEISFQEEKYRHHFP